MSSLVVPPPNRRLSRSLKIAFHRSIFYPPTPLKGGLRIIITMFYKIISHKKRLICFDLEDFLNLIFAAINSFE